MTADDKETLNLLSTHATVLANAENPIKKISTKVGENDEKTHSGSSKLRLSISSMFLRKGSIRKDI